MSGASLPWANSARLGLIGNLENRRISGFRAAVEQCGGAVSACVAYEEILRDPGALSSLDADFLRIDSPGENDAVHRALIHLGGGPLLSHLEFGEIAWLREYHLGFCEVLRRIEQTGLPCLNAPADIAVMFDKWECHNRFVARGISRPAATLAPRSFTELHREMRARGNGRLFLKPLHGSSASGVCALRWTPLHRQLIAPISIVSEGGSTKLVNSLSVRTYTDLNDIECILDRLLPQGMISEQWIPKVTLPGGSADLRVLVIAGEARHWVVRQSQSPMTNLHLGNKRGDPAALLDQIGPEKLQKAFDLAVRAASCFPDSLYAGVDVLIDSHHRPFIGEINAFGDLLPGLLHRGESTYEAIARACRGPVCSA